LALRSIQSPGLSALFFWRRFGLAFTLQALPSFQASITHKTTDEDATAMKTSGGRIRERVRELRDEYRRMPKAAA
jgi:hypothetical protein